MKVLWNLFWAFFRIGGLTFGGGYAMLPMMEKELVEKLKYTSKEELLDYFAIGQCTPGIIAVNTATFVGQKQKGIIGGIFATFGVIAPSIIIILIIAMFIENFLEIAWVAHAFAGIRVVVVCQIIATVTMLYKKGVTDNFGRIIVALIVILSLLFNIGSVYLVLMCGILGVMRVKMEGTK